MQSSLFSAAIAAVVFASATAINPARYVRIYDSQNDPSDYINLQLVTVYDCNGNYIQPAAATLSSTYSGAYAATNCIRNGTTFCHSRAGAAQWLQIDLGATFAVGKVVVQNRVDCCRNRIVGYTIALFENNNGQQFASAPQSFVTTQASYTFYFPDGGCPSPAEIGLGISNGLARYIYLTKAGTAILNLEEVMAFDCNGNYITANTAHLSGTHSSPWVASNCINNGTGSGCHSTGTSPWLSIDLGRLVAVSRIVVINRRSCCADRIAGFNIGLYSGPNGNSPIVPTQTFTGTAATYTFNFPTICPMQPAQLAAATASTAAQLAADFNTGMSSQIVAVTAALNNVNTNTLNTLASQLSTLSSQIAAESTTANGQITATLTQTSNQAMAVSNAVATLSTATTATLATVSSSVDAVSSTATANNGLITSLRTAIIAAATATPSGASGSQPMISSDDGSTLSVTSGNCMATDLCAATSFGNALKAAMAGL